MTKPMPMRFLRAVAPLALLASLTACSFAGPPRERTTLYSPDVRVQAASDWPVVEWQLMLVKPVAARMVDSPRIAVRPVPGELQVYRSASWAQPATDLVEATVLRALEDSGRIPAVARSGTGIGADYKLVMDLRRFESDYTGGDIPSATIELAAKLLDSRDQRVVAAQTFERVQPATGTEVGRVVVAFEQALQAITTELVAWTLRNGEQAHRQAHAP